MSLIPLHFKIDIGNHGYVLVHLLSITFDDNMCLAMA